MEQSEQHPPALPDGEPGFGIYIHWPFCLSKCPYCDFNSHVVASIDADAWQRAMLAALDAFAVRMAGWRVTSVFIGGGTPSLMPPGLVAALLERIAARWPLAADVEITLEANPTSAEAENFAAFAAAGVNRLSLGVQALNDADLAALGRTHSAREARQAWELARRHFARASFDLIHARPGQTMADWERELREALTMQPEHLSAYQLTMEPETPFYRLHARGRLELPGEDTALAMFRLTREMLADAGLEAYEVSNHAVPGEECRHNLLYWRYGPYAGIGPGAHGRLVDANGRRVALSTIRHPQRWLRAVLEDGAAPGLAEEQTLTAEEVALEYLLMSLRTREGADLARLQRLSGLRPAGAVISALVEEGLLHCPALRGNPVPPGDEAPRWIATTSRGLLVLEAIIDTLTDVLEPVNQARRSNG